MPIYMPKLCLEGISIYMLWLQPTMLESWKHDIIAILNLLDFHIVYCLVNRSVSFTRIILPPLPTKRPVGGLHEPLLMHSVCKGTKSFGIMMAFNTFYKKKPQKTWNVRK